MDTYSTSDLVRIAAAGGGFHISVARGVNDLMRIAAAAAQHKATIIIKEAVSLGVNDLVRIGAAGKGSVMFD